MAEETKKVSKAKKTTKAKKEEKVELKFAKPTFKDYEVILHPIITEKTMTLMQEQNKITLKVRPDTNKTEVKLAFERIYQVDVSDVAISNVNSKSKSRGTRYPGRVSGYKKAIVTVKDGEAIDLFKE